MENNGQDISDTNVIATEETTAEETTKAETAQKAVPAES